MSFKEPIPALVKRNGYEGHVSSHGKRGARQGCGIDLVTGIRSLKLPGPGAVAHMSLHQKPTMSKSHQRVPGETEEADNDRPPFFTAGDLLSVYVGDRREPFEAALSPSVRRLLWVTRDSVKPFFQKTFMVLPKARRDGGFGAKFSVRDVEDLA
jgi:hypothetical protein